MGESAEFANNANIRKMPSIALYTPMKLPNSPIPSGDILIARLIWRALEMAGFSVRLESEQVSYQKRPSLEKFKGIQERLLKERSRLAQAYHSGAIPVPDIWLTYHNYCKSPDFLGPYLAKEFGFKYVTAEACRTGQDTREEWMPGRTVAQAAIRAADINLSLKSADREYLKTFLPNLNSVVPLPPFLDVEQMVQELNGVTVKNPFATSDPVILIASMMRPGKKVLNYLGIAESLKPILEEKWNLLVVGDGQERPLIEDALSFIPDSRKHFTGAVARSQVLAHMKQSQIFFWPGIKEPIGMVYLEAQAMGLPVVASGLGGVPDVVSFKETGLLSVQESPHEWAGLLRRLLKNPCEREQMSLQGPVYVQKRHSLEAATQILRLNLTNLLKSG